MRVEARRSLGLSRMDLARRCGWRGDSRVANAENHGTPFEDQARVMFAHLKAEAQRQGKPFPYALEMYLSRRHQPGGAPEQRRTRKTHQPAGEGGNPNRHDQTRDHDRA